MSFCLTIKNKNYETFIYNFIRHNACRAGMGNTHY